MTVEEAIKSRRTIYNFRPDRISDEMISKILEAGIYAPNHKLTEPWRFTVLSRDTQAHVAELCAVVESSSLTPPQVSENKRRRVAKIMSKPNMIVVSCIQSPDEKQHHEDLLAVACAIQNIQLLAWELGVGCQWSTGKGIRVAAVLEELKIESTEVVVGFLYMGYPSEIPSARQRKPLKDVARWK